MNWVYYQPSSNSYRVNYLFNYRINNVVESEVLELNAFTKYKPLERLFFSMNNMESAMLLFNVFW